MSRASVLNEQDTTWEGCAVARASTLSRERGVMRLSRAAIVLSVLGVVSGDDDPDKPPIQAGHRNV
jgi:hypothetical protein